MKHKVITTLGILYNVLYVFILTGYTDRKAITATLATTWKCKHCEFYFYSDRIACTECGYTEFNK